MVNKPYRWKVIFVPILLLSVFCIAYLLFYGHKTRPEDEIEGWLIVNESVWRTTEARLDDVYSEDEVAAVRASFMWKYLHDHEFACQQTEWLARLKYRNSAAKHLVKLVEKLREISDSYSNHAIKEQCLLAITEAQYKSGNYKEAVISGKKILDATKNPKLIAQAYYYISCSAQSLGMSDDSRKFQQELRESFPDDAKRFLGRGKYKLGTKSEFEALRRQQINMFRKAEESSDAALKNQNISRELAQKYLKVEAAYKLKSLNFEKRYFGIPSSVDIDFIEELLTQMTDEIPLRRVTES